MQHNLSEQDIKSTVESRAFLSELKRLMKRIDKSRPFVCEENNCLLERSGYDDLVENGIWSAKAIRQEYANCLCSTSSFSVRTRKYIIKLGNLVLIKAYNKIHRK